MTELAVELQAKIEAVKKMYDALIEDDGNDSVVSEADNDLFTSAQRWHENSHVSDTEWICLFDQIKDKLVIKESALMTCPEEILDMLKSKFKETSWTKRFFISDLFSEQYLAHVKAFFEEKVDERDADDEFGELNIAQGWKCDDIPFYERTFAPVAIFYTYQAKHKNVKEENLFEDCFTLGSGSKRDDLIPEVNPYCLRCNAEMMKSKNIKIFKKQLANNFCLPNYKEYVSDSSDNEKEVVQEEVVQLDLSKTKVFNPLFSDSSSSDESDNIPSQSVTGKKLTVFNPLLSDTSADDLSEESDNQAASKVSNLKLFKCSRCHKTFSKEKFVLMHSSIFHKKIVVIPEFVSEPVDMMTTFVCEDLPNSAVELKTKNGQNMEKRKQSKENKDGQKKQKVQRNPPTNKKTSDAYSDKLRIRKSLQFDRS